MTQIDPLMPIGMFSRASLVSIKALRSYHENGLLVPASIDAATGYRSYRVSQLADAQIIRRLRDLDMPLRDIAEIMSARDPEVTSKIIAGHQAAMVERLEQVGRIVDELYAAAALPAIATPVHIRQQPEGHALATTGEVIEGDYATFLGDAFGRLWGALIAEGLAMVGPSAAMYPAEVRGDREEVIAFLPIGGPVQLGRAAVGAGRAVRRHRRRRGGLGQEPIRAPRALVAAWRAAAASARTSAIPASMAVTWAIRRCSSPT